MHVFVIETKESFCKFSA